MHHILTILIIITILAALCKFFYDEYVKPYMNWKRRKAQEQGSHNKEHLNWTQWKKEQHENKMIYGEKWKEFKYQYQIKIGLHTGNIIYVVGYSDTKYDNLKELIQNHVCIAVLSKKENKMQTDLIILKTVKSGNIVAEKYILSKGVAYMSWDVEEVIV